MTTADRAATAAAPGSGCRSPRGMGSLACCAVLALLLSTVACSGLPTPVRVVATPFTVVRDLVDAPLVSLTNVFQTWADHSNPVPTPGVGITAGRGGLRPGFFLGLGYYIWTPLSWIFGSVDWVVGRSLWPGWPTGEASPWRGRGQSWGSLYFPSTRELWRDDPDAAADRSDDAMGG